MEDDIVGKKGNDVGLGAISAIDEFRGAEQKALLNMMEDMQEEKGVLENQRIAIFNILDDVNEGQNELKLRYQELEVIKSLTQKLGLTLELESVMWDIVEALKVLFPGHAIAYAVTPFGSQKNTRTTVYIHTNLSLSIEYLRSVQSSLRLGFLTMPLIGGATNFLQQWIENKTQLMFVEGQLDSNTETVPLSQINVPMIVPGTIAGIVNLSSFEAGVYTKKKIELAHTIIASAAQTIERLKLLISSEHSRLQDLVESMSNGVVMVDANQRIIIANPVAKKIFGIVNENSSLDQIFEVIKKGKTNGGDDSEIEKAYAFASKEGKTQKIDSFELNRRFYEILITPVRDLQKEVSGGAIIFHDITHLKEIDRMKTEFVSVASHQLRTPLTAINWYVEMLRSGDAGKLNDEQMVFLDEIYTGSVRMVKLINELLNVSRIETGRLKIEPKPVFLDDYIESIIHELKALASEHSCEMEFRKPEKRLPMIAVDDILMRQVIHNLITNAIRYSSVGECGIAVSLEQKDTNYLVTVSDGGIGIPKESQARIFEKFFRADNAREKEAEGSGIGMYIAKMVVEASGGKLWFESPTAFREVNGKQEGYGTTFYLSIPQTGMIAHEGEKGLAT